MESLASMPGRKRSHGLFSRRRRLRITVIRMVLVPAINRKMFDNPTPAR
jgi:hypothetical protein